MFPPRSRQRRDAVRVEHGIGHHYHHRSVVGESGLHRLKAWWHEREHDEHPRHPHRHHHRHRPKPPPEPLAVDSGGSSGDDEASRPGSAGDAENTSADEDGPATRSEVPSPRTASSDPPVSHRTSVPTMRTGWRTPSDEQTGVMTDSGADEPARPSLPSVSRNPAPFPPQPVPAGQPTYASPLNRFSHPPPAHQPYAQPPLPGAGTVPRGPLQLPSALEEERANADWIRSHSAPSLPPSRSFSNPALASSGVTIPPPTSAFTPVTQAATMPGRFEPATLPSPPTAARALPGAFIPQPASAAALPPTTAMPYVPATSTSTPASLPSYAPAQGVSPAAAAAPYPVPSVPAMGPPPARALTRASTGQPTTQGKYSDGDSTADPLAGSGSQSARPFVDSSSLSYPQGDNASVTDALPGSFQQHQQADSAQGGDPYAPTPRSASVSAGGSAPPPTTSHGDDYSDGSDDSTPPFGASRQARSTAAAGSADSGSARRYTAADSAPRYDDDSDADYADSGLADLDPPTRSSAPTRAGMAGAAGMGGTGPVPYDPPSSSDSDQAFEPHAASASAAGTDSSDADPVSRFGPSARSPSSSLSQSQRANAQDAYSDADASGGESAFRPQAASSAGADSSDLNDSDGNSGYADPSQSMPGPPTSAARADRVSPPLASGGMGTGPYSWSSDPPAPDISDSDAYDPDATRPSAAHDQGGPDPSAAFAPQQRRDGDGDRPPRGHVTSDDADSDCGDDADNGSAGGLGDARSADPAPRRARRSASYNQDSGAQTDSSADDTPFNARSAGMTGRNGSSATPSAPDYYPSDNDYQTSSDDGSRPASALPSRQRDALPNTNFAPSSAQDDRGAGFGSDSSLGQDSPDYYSSPGAARPDASDGAVHTDSDADAPVSTSGMQGVAGQDPTSIGPSTRGNGRTQDGGTLPDDELDSRPDQPDPTADRDYADSRGEPAAGRTRRDSRDFDGSDQAPPTGEGYGGGVDDSHMQDSQERGASDDRIARGRQDAGRDEDAFAPNARDGSDGRSGAYDSNSSLDLTGSDSSFPDKGADKVDSDPDFSGQQGPRGPRQDGDAATGLQQAQQPDFGGGDDFDRGPQSSASNRRDDFSDYPGGGQQGGVDQQGGFGQQDDFGPGQGGGGQYRPSSGFDSNMNDGFGGGGAGGQPGYGSESDRYDTGYGGSQDWNDGGQDWNGSGQNSNTGATDRFSNPNLDNSNDGYGGGNDLGSGAADRWNDNPADFSGWENSYGRQRSDDEEPYSDDDSQPRWDGAAYGDDGWRSRNDRHQHQRNAKPRITEARRELRNALEEWHRVQHQRHHGQHDVSASFRRVMRCVYKLQSVEEADDQPISPYPTARELRLSDALYDEHLEHFRQRQERKIAELGRRHRMGEHSEAQSLLEDIKRHQQERAHEVHTTEDLHALRDLHVKNHLDALEAEHHARLGLSDAQAHLRACEARRPPDHEVVEAARRDVLAAKEELRRCELATHEAGLDTATLGPEHDTRIAARTVELAKHHMRHLRAAGAPAAEIAEAERQLQDAKEGHRRLLHGSAPEADSSKAHSSLAVQLSRLGADRLQAHDEVERARRDLEKNPHDHAARDRLHHAEQRLQKISRAREKLHRQLLARQANLEQDTGAAESDRLSAHHDAHLFALDRLHDASDRVEAARARLRAAENAHPRDEKAIEEAKTELQVAKRVRREAKSEEELRRHDTSARHRADASLLAVTHAEHAVQRRQKVLQAAQRENPRGADIALAKRRLEKAQKRLEIARAKHHHDTKEASAHEDLHQVQQHLTEAKSRHEAFHARLQAHPDDDEATKEAEAASHEVKTTEDRLRHLHTKLAHRQAKAELHRTHTRLEQLRRRNASPEDLREAEADHARAQHAVHRARERRLAARTEHVRALEVAAAASDDPALHRRLERERQKLLKRAELASAHPHPHDPGHQARYQDGRIPAVMPQPRHAERGHGSDAGRDDGAGHYHAGRRADGEHDPAEQHHRLRRLRDEHLRLARQHEEYLRADPNDLDASAAAHHHRQRYADLKAEVRHASSVTTREQRARAAPVAVADAQQHLAEALTALGHAEEQARTAPSSADRRRLEHAKAAVVAAKEALELAQFRQQRHDLKDAVATGQEEAARSASNRDHAQAVEKLRAAQERLDAFRNDHRAVLKANPQAGASVHERDEPGSRSRWEAKLREERARKQVKRAHTHLLEAERQHRNLQHDTSLSPAERNKHLSAHRQVLEDAQRAHLAATRRHHHAKARARYGRSQQKLQQTVEGTDGHAAAVNDQFQRSSALLRSRRRKMFERQAEAHEAEAKLAAEPDSPALLAEAASRHSRLERAADKLATHERHHEAFLLRHKAVLERHKGTEQEDQAHAAADHNARALRFRVKQARRQPRRRTKTASRTRLDPRKKHYVPASREGENIPRVLRHRDSHHDSTSPLPAGHSAHSSAHASAHLPRHHSEPDSAHSLHRTSSHLDSTSHAPLSVKSSGASSSTDHPQTLGADREGHPVVEASPTGENKVLSHVDQDHVHSDSQDSDWEDLHAGAAQTTSRHSRSRRQWERPSRSSSRSRHRSQLHTRASSPRSSSPHRHSRPTWPTSGDHPHGVQPGHRDGHGAEQSPEAADARTDHRASRLALPAPYTHTESEWEDEEVEGDHGASEQYNATAPSSGSPSYHLSLTDLRRQRQHQRRSSPSRHAAVSPRGPAGVPRRLPFHGRGPCHARRMLPHGHARQVRGAEGNGSIGGHGDVHTDSEPEAAEPLEGDRGRHSFPPSLPGRHRLRSPTPHPVLPGNHGHHGPARTSRHHLALTSHHQPVGSAHHVHQHRGSSPQSQTPEDAHADSDSAERQRREEQRAHALAALGSRASSPSSRSRSSRSQSPSSRSREESHHSVALPHHPGGRPHSHAGVRSRPPSHDTSPHQRSHRRRRSR